MSEPHDRRPALAHLLFATAASDGPVGEAERRAIAAMLEPGIDTRRAERTMRRANLVGAVRLFRDDGFAMRVSLLALLGAVARADGPIGRLEQRFLLEVARHLELASPRTRLVAIRPPILEHAELVELLRVRRSAPRERSDIRAIVRPPPPSKDRVA